MSSYKKHVFNNNLPTLDKFLVTWNCNLYWAALGLSFHRIKSLFVYVYEHNSLGSPGNCNLNYRLVFFSFILFYRIDVNNFELIYLYCSKIMKRWTQSKMIQMHEIFITYLVHPCFCGKKDSILDFIFQNFCILRTCSMSIFNQTVMTTTLY